jgi:signal transduction histidine kinase
MIATAVVAAVLAIAGILLVVATRSALYRSVETTATARAADIATQLTTGTSFTRVPLVRGISVQIVTEGTVVASTGDIEGQRPIIDVAGDTGASGIVVVPTLDVAENQGETPSDDGDEGPFLVAVTGAHSNGRPSTVLAAASLSAVDNATRTLIPLITLGIPAITLLVALVVSRLTRRAFRPIDAMTRQADTISYSYLHRRITEPEPEDEIRRLAVVLNGMLDRLDTSAARQRQFTADASHELKSPVATLLTMAEVAESSPRGFTVEELAADVAGQSRRLAALVDDLLTLAQSDEHRLQLHQEWFDIAEVVIGELAVASTTPLDIDTSCLASGVVFGDRRRVGQVVRNLLDNATHHASTKIRVESLLAAGQVVLSIGDDGPGIPPADRERIFDRFVRLDKARSRQSGGTGLGLSVVRSIVDAHHGTIIVDRDHDLGGASITVMLPVGLAGQGSSVAAT